MSGSPVARVVAVIVAGVSLIVNFVALPIYPFGSIIVMAIDVLVIWAVIVHGREVRAIPDAQGRTGPHSAVDGR